jgi:thiamine pyrophosphokinase
VRAIIFANGLIPEGSIERHPLIADDMLIAADGGARACINLNRPPDVVIGDFDSIADDEREWLRRADVQFVRHPARKDFTDLELAIRHAVEAGASEILVFGALGARWDQSLANTLLLGLSEWAGTRLWLLHGQQELTAIRGGERLTLHGMPGDTVSLLPIAGEARGVATDGLEYPLHGETLYFGATRGVSNSMLDEQATVSLMEGQLIVVIIHGEAREE